MINNKITVLTHSNTTYMSEQESASERLQNRISKLAQEKHLLRSRLNILVRENNPPSKSREQTRRAQQIEDINKRINLIDEELRSGRYFLARAEDKPIQEISDLFQNLSVGQGGKENKLNKLEEFINLTAKSEMVFHSPTKESEVANLDTVTTSVPTNCKPMEFLFRA